jgi:hypothetical protein
LHGVNDVHKCIVDGDNENLSSALDIGVGHVSWDVRIRAGWAFDMLASLSFLFCQFF